jgi:hypothetical protein
MDIDVDQIRKMSSVEMGKRAVEERFSSPKLSAVDAALLQKAASADRVLLEVAASLRPDDLLATYEDLGGTYLVED